MTKKCYTEQRCYYIAITRRKRSDTKTRLVPVTFDDRDEYTLNKALISKIQLILLAHY